MDKIITYTDEQKQRYIDELKSYLAIPSISSNPDNKEAMMQCAEYTANLLRDAGVENVKVNETPGHPVVTGDWMHAQGKPTLLIYGHYDVQPVDPIELWEKDPFEAHIANDRIVARGSADDKGQVFMHFKAVEAFNKVAGELPVNVKFVVEGEEEIASPSLPGFLKANNDLLKSDVALISDTSMLGVDMPAITYGLRGMAYLEIEITGPNRDLHSGEYGGTVANPAEMLARLLAGVKDDQGRIQIPGFYDSVVEIGQVERNMLADVPFDEVKYKSDLGVDELWGELSFSPLERTWIRPTFEINGIWGGFTGVGAKTVLPAKAFAKVSMRLVPDQDPEEIADLVEDYLNKQIPRNVTIKIIRHAGGHPVVAPVDSPYISAARKALAESFKREPFMVRGGGSIPITAEFKRILGLDSLLVGFSLPDCRAHSPNENMHLPSFFTGIESLIRMMQEIGK